MAQTANNTHTTDPDTFGLNGNSGIPSEDNVVITVKAAASTHYYRRDLVTLSTTTNTLAKCTGKASVFDGVVLDEVDNSDGAAGDLYVSVLVKGFIDLNGFVEATGETEDDTITFNDLVYLSADTVGVGAGQKVTSLDASSTLVGRAFDYTVSGTADKNIVLRTYIDCIAKSFT